jgi:predicted MFS family arabinose efflux permease
VTTVPEEPAPHLPLFLLGLACFAANISVRAVDPMLPVIAGQFSVTLHQAAWLATVYGIPYALTQPILGPIADAFGKSIVIKICLGLLAVGFAACALAPGFTTLLIARGLSGAVAGGIVPVVFALVGDRVPTRNARSRFRAWSSRLSRARWAERCFPVSWRPMPAGAACSR